MKTNWLRASWEAFLKLLLKLEPHFMVFIGLAMLYETQRGTHPFDPVVSITILTITGGPTAREAIVAIIRAWKGTDRAAPPREEEGNPR